jgi:hypothetical protein
LNPCDETPGDVMIHVVPENSKSRWSHIEDLDSFFKNVYAYHQGHGFKVMMLQRFSELFQVRLEFRNRIGKSSQ